MAKNPKAIEKVEDKLPEHLPDSVKKLIAEQTKGKKIVKVEVVESVYSVEGKSKEEILAEYKANKRKEVA